MSIVYSLYQKLQTTLRHIVYVNPEKIAFLFRGEGSTIHHTLVYSGEENISIGSHSIIGVNCIMYATRAKLSIGNYVLISPNVTFITGEHRTDIIGEYIRNVTDEMKLPQHDKDISIEDDVWIGSNVTILKGVTIGRGSIIHAGAVVSKRVPPYTIYINDKVKVARFSDDEIIEHERLLHEKYGVIYPPYVPKKGGSTFSR